MQKKLGYTLIEMMLVISIIALLGGIVLVSVNSARSKARDAKRIADMGKIREALGFFYRDHGRYPGGTYEGVDLVFEYIGVGDDIDTALAPYFPGGVIPRDPLHDGVTYYYAYDPQHNVTTCDTGQVLDQGVAVSINNFEGNPAGAHKETCSGANGNIHNADFNFVLWPSSL